MAIKFVGGPPADKPKKTKKTQSEASREAFREWKKELHFKMRREIEEDFFTELNGKKVPEVVEDAIDGGVLSAQEIIHLYEQAQLKPLGPRQRKYVVANVLAKLMALDKAPSASEYCPEVADLIIERMIEGQSINTICKDKFMPGFCQFYKWMRENPELRDKYEEAKRIQVESLVMDAVDEASRPRIGVQLTRKADGSVEVYTSDNVNRSRVKVDTIKWYAAKVVPRIYGQVDPNADTGNKMIIKVTGGLPDTPVPDGPADVQSIADPESKTLDIKVTGGVSKDAVGGLPE